MIAKKPSALCVLSGQALSDQAAARVRPSYASVERANAAIDRYSSGQRRFYGWTQDGELVGCVGLEIDGSVARVRSIGVEPSHRKRGIGRRMLEAALQHTAVTWCEAETDAEAVGFYQRAGFTVTSRGEKYPGVERFHCSWRVG
jgi:ribosomal protein S18 acetylase RimI-like enzyme